MNAALYDILKSLGKEEFTSLENAMLLLKSEKKETLIPLPVFRDEYLQHIREFYSFKYYTSVTLSFRHLINYFGKETLLSEINRRIAEKFILETRKQAPKGVKNYLRNLSAALNKALDWGYLSENPFAKIKLPKTQKNKPAFISLEEMFRIAKNIKHLIIRDAVVFDFFTGLRENELTNLTYGDVNLKENIITIGSGNFTTKSRKQRILPICDKVKEILIKYYPTSLPIESNYVFRKADSSPFSNDFVSRMFKKAIRSLPELDQALHFHSIRHSYASHLVRQGVPLIKVQHLLGHSSIQTTEIYSHVTEEDIKDVVKYLNIESLRKVE